MGIRLIAQNADDLQKKEYQFNKLYGYINIDECQEMESARFLLNLKRELVGDDFFRLNYEHLAYNPELISEQIRLTRDEFSEFMKLYEHDIIKHYKENDFSLAKYFSEEMRNLLSDSGDKYIFWG